MFLPSTPTSSIPRHAAVVIPDDLAIQALIEELLHRAGLSQSDAAVRMGVSRQYIGQYKTLRKKPTLSWLVKLAETCGARIVIEFPDRPLL